MTLPSLERRLRRHVGIAVAAVLVVMGGIAAYRSISELNELSDTRLRQTAATLDALLQKTGVTADFPGGGRLQELPAVPVVVNGKGPVSTYEAEVGYRVTAARGKVLLFTSNMRELPASMPLDEAIHSVVVRRRRWHVYTRHDPLLGVTISVAERHDSRRDVINAVALERSLPLLVGLPLLFLALRWAVRRSLRPLDALTSMLLARRVGSHEPVVLSNPPGEIVPIVDALNTQIAAIERSLEREQRFSADVAHELRTPIAASMIGLESALAVGSSEFTATALPEALESLRQLGRRTEQLLILARLDEEHAMPRGMVDVVTVARDVLTEWQPTVDLRRFTLDVDLPGAALQVEGHAMALAAMIRNLLENAARHVPDHGKVLLRVSGDDAEVVVDVVDNGPGIPLERREAVFVRFHREKAGLGDGFGVGLSIVQRVAQLQGATLSFDDAPWGGGLWVRVRMPVRHANAGFGKPRES